MQWEKRFKKDEPKRAISTGRYSRAFGRAPERHCARTLPVEATSVAEIVYGI